MALTNKKEYRTCVMSGSSMRVREVTRTMGTCTCGRVVHIEYDDTECECGRCYNLFGQELKSHEQRWREKYCDY